MPAAPKYLQIYVLGEKAEYGCTGVSCWEHGTLPNLRVKLGQGPHGEDLGGAVVCSLGRYVYMFAGYHTHLLTHLCVGGVCVCKNMKKDE